MAGPKLRDYRKPRVPATHWMVLVGVMAGIMALGATCTKDAEARSTKHYVVIELDRLSCPVAVYPLQLDVAKKDRIVWQTVAREINWRGDFVSFVETPKQYSILFDPFAGPVIWSDFYGRAESKQVRMSLPDEEVVYKYTVVSVDDSGCPPLDPKIRVGRGG